MLKKLFFWTLFSSLLFNQLGYAQLCVDPKTNETIPCPEGFKSKQDPNVVAPEPYLAPEDKEKARQAFPKMMGNQPGGSESPGAQPSGFDGSGAQPGGTGETMEFGREPSQTDKTFGETAKKLEAAEKFKGLRKIGSTPTFPPIPFESSTGKPLQASDAVKFLGTSLFLDCQRQTAKAWPDMVSTYKSKTTTDMWTDSWWTLAKSIEQKFEEFKLNPQEVQALEKGGKGADFSGMGQDSGGGGFGSDSYGDASGIGGDTGPQTDSVQVFNTGNPLNDARAKILAVKSFVRKGIARGKGKSLTLNKCSALVPSTSFIDYNSSQDTLAITPKASLDRRIACRSRGAETQDYPNCRKLVGWWDAFFIGKKIMETAQKVKYQMDAKDRQEDLALDMASKNPDPLLPLKMQKAGVDDQAAVAFQNSFFLGAQYAVMQTMFSKWPSREEVVQTCQRGFTGEKKPTTMDKAEGFFESFKGKKVEPKAEVEKEDPNLKAYMDWFKELVTGFAPYAKKIQITNLLDDFKKESEIVASCPVPPRSPMSGMMGGGYGGGYGGGGYGGGGYGGYTPDYGGVSGTSSGEGEGAIGALQYQNCDQIFMQNLQTDAQSQPQMPQGMMSGGAAGMMGGGGYGQDQYGGGGGYGGGGYDQYGGGGGMMGGMMGGMGGMPGGEMVMGGMLGQSADPCIDVMNSGTQLILNFQSREALKLVLVQTGIEALTNLMKGMMLRKQSAKIQSLIDGMPVPDPTLDKLSQTEEDLIASVCQIAPQEPICADFSNRANGFYSPNIDLTPPGAATTLARVKAEEQGANAIEKEMAEIAATIGESGAISDASREAGGPAGKTPSVTFKAAEKGGAGGDITTDAKVSEAVTAAEKGAGGEETATPETGYTGGTEAREYKGPGFRADQYKGQEGGQDKIAGEYGSLGFREPSSEGISPKEAGGLFKIISDRYETISKDHRIETKSEIAK